MIVRRAHLHEYVVQPLQGPVQVNLYPTRGGGDVLPVVIRPPALNEGHPDGAHLGQLVHGLEALIDALLEQLCELCEVEDSQGAARRDLAHGGGEELVVVVAVPRLHEDGRVGQTLGVDLALVEAEVDAAADVSPRVFDRRVAVHVGQLTQTEAVVVLARRVREPVHGHVVARGVIDFPHAAVQLVVGDAAPLQRLLIRNRSARDVVVRGRRGAVLLRLLLLLLRLLLRLSVGGHGV